MTQVQFPDMRMNLIVAIDYLANSVEKPLIMVRDGEKVTEYFDFKMAIHQIFDDMSLTEGVYSAIGVYLKNESEADIMKQLIENLEVVMPKDYPDGTKEWLNMVDIAKVAVRIFNA